MNNNPSPKQKWLLTAALVAILGANYSYQVSSLAKENTLGKFDLASEVKSEMESQNEAYMAQQKEAAATRARQTQAGTTEQGTCVGCATTAASATVTMSLETQKQLLAEIDALKKANEDNKKKIEEQATALKVAADKKDDKKDEKKDDEDKPKKETATEKRIRLAREKREAEMKAREDRATLFDEEVRAIRSICDVDMECLVNEFTKTLRDNYSRDKEALPAGLVTRAYKSLIGTRLSRVLYSGDAGEGLDIIESLMEKMPDRYKGIKESIMSAVHTSSISRAQGVNSNYKTLQALSKQNNPEAYFKQLEVTRSEHQALQDQASMYTMAIESNLGSDSSALNYYERTYMPNMRKLMASLHNPAGIDASGATTVEGTSTRTSTTRGGRTTTVETTGDKVTTRTGTTTNGVQWTVGNQPNSGTVLKGTPATAPRQDGRSGTRN